MRLIEYLKLLRIPQWYKNLVIFLAVFFVGDLFSISLIEKTLLGFIALCLVSSANYVLNDIIDIKRDRVHPEKKSRPLAAGTVSVAEAVVLTILLLAGASVIAYSLSLMFFVAVAALFVLTVAYSLYLKKEPIADVIAIAVNFVIRAVSGAFIIKVFVSPWIIVCPFFLALFLAVGKREADLKLLKDDARKHKEVLQKYSLEMTNSMMIISMTCLIIAYALYSFSRTSLMLVTLPFAIYILLRYYYLISNGSEIARHPDRIYKDAKIMIAGLMLALLVFVIFYMITPEHIKYIIA